MRLKIGAAPIAVRDRLRDGRAKEGAPPACAGRGGSADGRDVLRFGAVVGNLERKVRMGAPGGEEALRMLLRVAREGEEARRDALGLSAPR